MAPLIALVAVTGVLLILGRARWRPQLRSVPLALRGGLAAMFAMTGISHFVGMRADLVAMVPAWVPAPDLIITLTGIAEIAGAVGLLWSRTVLPASAGLTLLLVVMFPANVHLALTGADLPWWDQLVPRTILQVLFLGATGTVLGHRWRTHRQSATARTAVARIGAPHLQEQR
ncbi:DoxX family protein [Ruania zhangjianzhongii]|uniref:DoxX family protein n=1 Tax=Ruania zhangjianzhongii TaxID=2603206 RepID=UPI0011C7477F|nr:DoxX family protein [Ruania zhangjianzhongii]